MRLMALPAVVLALASCAVPSPVTTLSPGPANPANALALLECDGGPSRLGGIGPFGLRGAATADQALAVWLSDPLFLVPVEGWERLHALVDGAVYVFRNQGEVKLVAVIRAGAGEGGETFGLAELRACDESEFGPGANFGRGERLWTNLDGLILRDAPGPEHCGWQHARFLSIGEGEAYRQYVADPLAILPPGGLSRPYDADAELPDDAVASGYVSGDWELWFVPDEHAVFVVTPGWVELWPRMDPPIGCD